MAAARARRARGEETRDRIHAAALSLFRKKGFEATTMRDIAAAGEVALGAAYYYFPSKEAIVLAYYERTHAESGALVEAAFARTRDVRERLGAVLHAKLDVIAKDRKLLSGLFQSIADPSAEASIFGERTRAVRDESLQQLDRAIAPAPELAALDAEARRVLVLALWSLHMGVILYFIHDTSPKQRRTRALVDSSLDLVSGLLPLAPQLAPMFGSAIGTILREAGLLSAPRVSAIEGASRVLASATVLELHGGIADASRSAMIRSSSEAKHAAVGGLVSGLVAGAILTSLMTVMSAGAGKDVWYGMKGAAAPFLGDRAMAPGFDGGAVALGLLDHFAISAIWGVAFGLLFYGLGSRATVAAGAVWGLVVWAGMYGVVLPAVGLAQMTHEVPVPRAIMFHMFFSLPLAIAFLGFQREHRTERRVLA